MRNLLRITTVLLALAIGGTMTHAEVPKEHRGTFSRARAALASVENGLHVTRDKPTERAVAEAEKRMSKVDELVAKLPAAEPDVVELVKRRAIVKAEIDRRRAILNGKAAEAAAGNAALEAGADTDLTTMEAVRASLVEIRRALDDTTSTEGLALWPRVRDDARALVAKYKGKRGATDAAREMERQTRMLDSELASVQEHVAEAGVDLARLATRYIDDADTNTAPGKEDTNIDAFVGAIRNAQRGGALLDKLEVLARGEPTIDTSAVAPQRARIAAIEARIAAAKTKIMAKAEVPVERYAGGDREKLRAAIAAAWKERNAKFPAIKIVLGDAGWVRRTEWVLESDRWKKVDVSTMRGIVFIKADASTSHYYAVGLVKNHLAADRVTVDVLATSGNPANWEQVVALSRVTKK